MPGFGFTVSEKKTEAIHLWTDLSTASNALRIEEVDQRYKQKIEIVYLGGLISESADLDAEIERRIDVAWVHVTRYSFQLHNQRNTKLSLKTRLSKAEVVVAMLYVCATWTMRSQDFGSLRTAHHKLLLRVIGFWCKDRTGHKPLSYGDARGSVPNASRPYFGSANLGSPGPLFDNATQGSPSESRLGDWRSKGPREEAVRRRLGGTTTRKTSRPSGQSQAKAKDGSGPHSELLLSRMDRIG